MINLSFAVCVEIHQRFFSYSTCGREPPILQPTIRLASIWRRVCETSLRASHPGDAADLPVVQWRSSARRPFPPLPHHMHGYLLPLASYLPLTFVSILTSNFSLSFHLPPLIFPSTSSHLSSLASCTFLCVHSFFPSLSLSFCLFVVFLSSQLPYICTLLSFHFLHPQILSSSFSTPLEHLSVLTCFPFPPPYPPGSHYLILIPLLFFQAGKPPSPLYPGFISFSLTCPSSLFFHPFCPFPLPLVMHVCLAHPF